MKNLSIFFPIFALAFWTFVVLLVIPFVRIRAARNKEVMPEDFKYGESAAVPGPVSIPNRNFMNLLELPILFYVVCLVLFNTAGASSLTVILAWIYVALRVVHSLIHLTYNNVIHRLVAAAASAVVLAVMWILAFMHVSAYA